MKESPILFSTPMVQAILQGRKTQTRRLVKRKALEWLAPDMFTPEFVAENFNPYGDEGDLLWVRESFFLDEMYVQGKLLSQHCNFKTSFPDPSKYKWKPSIHLKKEHARIWLQNTGYKIERLNDISKEDAIAEGIEPIGKLGYRNYMTPPDMVGVVNPTNSFQSLWQSIHGPDSWKENPWVWAVSFKVIF